MPSCARHTNRAPGACKFTRGSGGLAPFVLSSLVALNFVGSSASLCDFYRHDVSRLLANTSLIWTLVH
eukprot:5094225-Prymnesium_polylepis.2